jgi:3-deoxy-manno-octulosonate cytidylyltransferase (CMP-KDO synthetase)
MTQRSDKDPSGDATVGVAIVIPARYASTRFPGKPLAMIEGKPMIQHVYEQCSRSHHGSLVIVATDDARITDVVTGYGGLVHMTPSECASGTERMACVARNRSEQIYVNVQGDEPMIDPATIDATVDLLLGNERFDIATACVPLRSLAEYLNPNVVKVVTAADGTALYFSRAPIPHRRSAADDSPPPEARKHLGIYAFRRSALKHFAASAPSPLEMIEQLEQLRAFDLDLRIGVVAVAHDSIAVDVPDDIDKVHAAMSARRKGS